MKRNWIASTLTLAFAMFGFSGCGNAFTVGQGVVTVDGLSAGQLVLCGASNEVLQISGSGFLSEHGNEVIVEFTALQGTPFDGEASEQVVGIALSDSLVEALLPQIQGAAELTLKVILPGSNFGVSPPETIQLGGQLVGPFANGDSFSGITGNVTYNAAAPGVLVNDDPSFCASEDITAEKPRGWHNEVSRSLLLQNLSVATPPPGFEDDATPGVTKMTTATPPGGERGTVTIEADGSFVYEPPLGYEGSDGFFYWVQEAGRPNPDRAFVQLTVNKVVWFIRDTAVNESIAFVGTGRFSDPFDSLFSFNNAQNVPPTNPFDFPPTGPILPNPDNAPQEGDCIFVYDNVITNEYDGGIRLRDRQQLIGERVGLFLNNTQIVPAGIDPSSSPVLANSIPFTGDDGGLPVVTLGNENVVRGIDIDQPLQTDGRSQGLAGDGIYGFDVSGPTLIDLVRIRNMEANGIHLQGFGSFDLQGSTQPIIGGIYQIGDPNGQLPVQVEILNSGNHGIFIEGGFGQASVSTAATNGLTVNVDATDIVGTGFTSSGIEANDVNLNVNFAIIDDCWNGINYTNNLFGQLCTLDVQNSNFGIGSGQAELRNHGIRINPFGPVNANISTNFGISENTFLYGGFFSTGGQFEISVDLNNMYTTDPGEVQRVLPTVDIFGFSTVVTSLESTQIIGIGNGGGMRFTDVTFDADPSNMAVDQVDGGNNTDIGGPGAPINGTALEFFNCVGDLAFSAVDVVQTGGDPAGFVNTGTLVLDLGTFTLTLVP